MKKTYSYAEKWEFCKKYFLRTPTSAERETFERDKARKEMLKETCSHNWEQVNDQVISWIETDDGSKKIPHKKMYYVPHSASVRFLETIEGLDSFDCYLYLDREEFSSHPLRVEGDENCSEYEIFREDKVVGLIRDPLYLILFSDFLV